ncbi:AMP-binding protein [Streptomyces rubradiris]|uniref:AMP-binding protein n=1 Tax=Streptomyces rubradiris TaxID=285531 RepID=UPI001E3E8203|nr:AMP-binding protein [Streptomyces rubradiris]
MRDSVRAELIRALPLVLREHADNFGGKVAFEDAERAVTYADLEARTRRLAGHLAGLGVRRGDRVMICLRNSVEMLESYLAILRADAIRGAGQPRVHRLRTGPISWPTARRPSSSPTPCTWPASCARRPCPAAPGCW